MNLIKNTIVVPSTTPTPNQDSERVALFNEDGSPFSAGGGGAVLLYANSYYDSASTYETLELKPSGNQPMGSITPEAAGVNPAKTTRWFVNSDLVSVNSEDAASIQTSAFSELGPGFLTVTSTVWNRNNGTLPAMWSGNLNTDVLPGPEFANRWDSPWYNSIEHLAFMRGPSYITTTVAITEDWPSAHISITPYYFNVTHPSGAFSAGVAIKKFQLEISYTPSA